MLKNFIFHKCECTKRRCLHLLGKFQHFYVENQTQSGVTLSPRYKSKDWQAQHYTVQGSRRKLAPALRDQVTFCVCYFQGLYQWDGAHEHCGQIFPTQSTHTLIPGNTVSHTPNNALPDFQVFLNACEVTPKIKSTSLPLVSLAPICISLNYT